MIFYAIFWSTYVPFVVLALSLLVERLTHRAKNDVARQAQPVPVTAKPLNRAPKGVGAPR